MCRPSPDPLSSLVSQSESPGPVTSLFWSSRFLEVVPKVWGAETHTQRDLEVMGGGQEGAPVPRCPLRYICWQRRE